MKKQTKKFDPSYGKRTEWISNVNDEIDLFADEILELDMSDKVKEIIEREIKKLKENTKDLIQGFEIDTKMVFAQEDLFEYCLDDIYYERGAVAGEGDLERMKEIVEMENKGQFVKAESLAEQIKLDAFIEELKENPYQLKLIA